MERRNQLFFIIFILISVAGCGSLPSGRESGARSARAPTASTPTPSSHRRGVAPSRDTELLFQALAAAGTDYRFGGESHQGGFDCSGLVAFVYREAYGLVLPHNSHAQSTMGESVAPSDMQPGDLVFFNTQRRPNSHVGIYLGEGRFIHAPRTGAVVRTDKLAARYWATRFDGARRIVPRVTAVDYPRPRNKPVVTYP